MPTAVRSHAKVNLGLHIGAPRADGFHPLATVYQTLELHDVVTVSARPASATRIQLTSNDQRVPTDNRNTAWKMAALALEALGITAEVEIHIDKRLPVQGGLGAGSANAVAALVGLEVELGIACQQVSESAGQRVSEVRGIPPIEQNTLDGWGTRLSVESAGQLGGPGLEFETWDNWIARRLEIAAQVGSDVPLFLIGGTVLGQDRGQIVSALPDLEPTWCVVAVPSVGVSTPQAFRDWDALCAAEGLTAEASQDRLKELSRAYVSAFSEAIPEGRQGAGSSGVLTLGEDLAGPLKSALVRTGITSWIENDFERVVFRQHPSLAEIKRILLGPGTPEAALHASLSGSGSALYGLYQTREDAEAAQVRLKQRFQETEVRSTLTRTLPRKAYWSEMILK
ncbi:MAG: 4-(cytidine 5'-diphospho)-2-C-methyl-D-erythritol kinase [Terracidiphilus sp.]